MYHRIEGIVSILKASTTTRTLQKLECVYNTLGQSDFIAITEYVRSSNSRVRRLNISYNDFQHCYTNIITILCCEEDDIKKCMLPPDQFYIAPETDPKFVNDIITCYIKDSNADQLIIKESAWSFF